MTDLPSALREPVAAALRAAGDSSPISSLHPLGGGCINHAQRLETEKGRYLLKWNARPLLGMFPAEARGLELLAATRTVRVPGVVAVQDASEQGPAFIITEFLEDETGRGRQDQEALGRKLARMHQSPAPAEYGLDIDNYLGSTVQKNGWERDWVTFFGEKRLRFQMELAQRNGRMPSGRRQKLEKLIEQLRAMIGDVARRPSLLHGDLWGGNVIPGPGGEPALIDPAVYYGDREAEIAFTELFGGFSGRFYAAYNETWPLDAGYRARRDLYNLYHLLNHLNLFGEGYGYEVDEVLRYYVG